MKLKVDSSKSPAFNYFVLRINKENGFGDDIDLPQAHKTAVEYIKKKYPEAKAGSNYYTEINAPLAEAYFLRKLTSRICTPPYIDQAIPGLEKEVISYVKEHAETVDTDSIDLMPQCLFNCFPAFR